MSEFDRYNELIDKALQRTLKTEEEIELKEHEKEQAKLDEAEFEKLKEASKDTIVTTGFNFEGYKILEYKGFISREEALVIKVKHSNIDELIGRQTNSIKMKFYNTREALMERLKISALKNDANAIIGVDADYTMIGDSILAIILSGTAVVVEKE